MHDAISLAAPVVEQFEGCRLAPYRCAAGVATIGFGATRHPDGRRVSLDDREITETEARQYLDHDLIRFAKGVRRLIHVKLDPQEEAALISFSFNVGLGNLQSSTLRQKLNRADYMGAANEFPKWRRAGGRILRGLVLRRAAERNLFLS